MDKTASLIPMLRSVMCDKATEHPYSGVYHEMQSLGTYLCRRCGLALFRADSQFNAGCGWPSFDACLSESVIQALDEDGLRTEILCARCDAHLGHVFFGEQHTARNVRYCVNSVSLDFVDDSTVLDSEEALVAGGCFWGVDYYLARIPGVMKVEVGYLGGTTAFPTYEQVCSGETGHYEVVRVLFDVAKTSYQAVLKRFFEIHDPTQQSGQGPDLGQQYHSAVFYYNEEQCEQIKKLVNALILKGYDVVTRVLPVQLFWPAEDYHQHYYFKHNKKPYCHQPVERFK